MIKHITTFFAFSLALIVLLGIGESTGTSFQIKSSEPKVEISSVAEVRAPAATTRSVLAECFTATWCTYCQGAEGALDRLAKEYPLTQLSILEWHKDDAYSPPDGSNTARESYYGITGIPTTWFDGVESVVGGSANPDDPTVYNNYKTKIDQRLAVPANLTITVTGSLGSTTGTINANITAIGNITLSNLKVRFVIYEDHNYTVIVSGRTYRLRYTVVNGTMVEPLSISKEQSVQFTKTFNIDSAWERIKLGAVVFVQSDSTREVLQSTALNFSSQKPDLAITSYDISFSNPNPNQGETITIYAIVRNVGNKTANNVGVRFYNGSPSAGGVQIGFEQNAGTIAPGGSVQVQVAWNTSNSFGDREIWVVVDSNNANSEFENENNNIAPRTIHVIPRNDVGIDSIENPKDCGTYIPSELPIRATLKNYGASPQSNFNVRCEVVEIAQKAETITLLSQDFSGTFPPAGWSKYTGNPATEWKQSNTNKAGGTAPEANFHYPSASTTSVWRLYAGPINTTGMTSLTLEWANYYDDYGPGVTVKIETSSDGSIWHDTSWVKPSGNGNIGPGKQTLIIETSDVGSSTFYFSFTVDGNAYQLNDWWVDNVVLTYSKPEISNVIYTSEKTVSDVLAQNQTYKLDWKYKFSNLTSYRITVQTLLPNDDYSNNNAKTINVNINSTGSYIFELRKGWNFIILPLKTPYKNAGEFGSNVSNCVAISRWNATSQSFEEHLVGTASNNFTLNNGCGYFVYVTADTTFTTAAGLALENVTVILSAGWNALGWYNSTDTTLEDIAKNISGCGAVALWDCSSTRFIVHPIGTALSNFIVRQGDGYFVFVY